MVKRVVVNSSVWTVALVATTAIAITAVVVGSVALRNTNSLGRRPDDQDIMHVLSCFSVGLSQKNIDAYVDYMTPDAYIDFTEAGAPVAGPVSEWIPFQEFVWEFYVQTQTITFPTPCITIESGTNASVVAAYSSFQSSYTVETPGDSRLPAAISTSTANFNFFKTSGGWKITSLIIQPNGTLIGISPSISGVIDPPLKRSTRTTMTAVELQHKHYFEMLLAKYEQMQRPDLVAILQLNPEYIRLMSM